MKTSLIPLSNLNLCGIRNGFLIELATPASLPVYVGELYFYQNRTVTALKSYFTPTDAKDGILVSFGDQEFSIIDSETK